MLQPYIISPDQRAQRVKVTWTHLAGLIVELYSNEKGYFKPRTEAKEPHQVHFEPFPRELDLKEVFVTPFANIVQCRLSQATAELSNTVEYVRNLLEKSVLSGSGRKLCSLAVNMMRDIKGKWYFIGIEEYQIEAKRQSPRPQAVSERLLLRGSCPTSRHNSPTPELSVSPQSHQPVSADPFKPASKCSTPLPFRIPTSLHIKQTSEVGVDYGFSRDRPITDRRQYQQMLTLEANIADLIDLKANPPLSFLTYRAWKQRQTDSPTLSSIDHLYARKLAEKAKLVRKQTASAQLQLSQLRQKLLDSMAVASVAPAQVAQTAGKMLLSRVQIKKAVHIADKLIPNKSKILEKYKKSQNATVGERNARSLVNYAASKMDSLRRSNC